MKATRRNPLKEARETSTFAALFTLTVTGPTTLIAGIILIAVSHSERLASIVFASIFVADFLGMIWWSRRQTARQKQKKGTNLIPEVQMTVHGFIAPVKIHPELLPAGMTEFDLERFRKLCSGTSQAGIDQWVEQCSRRTHEQQS